MSLFYLQCEGEIFVCADVLESWDGVSGEIFWHGIIPAVSREGSLQRSPYCWNNLWPGWRVKTGVGSSRQNYCGLNCCCQYQIFHGDLCWKSDVCCKIELIVLQRYIYTNLIIYIFVLHILLKKNAKLCIIDSTTKVTKKLSFFMFFKDLYLRGGSHI